MALRRSRTGTARHTFIWWAINESEDYNVLPGYLQTEDRTTPRL